VLKIENTEPGKDEQTEKGQQLIAPFHFVSCSGGLRPSQISGNVDQMF
jgi:hypothetical protein